MLYINRLVLTHRLQKYKIILWKVIIIKIFHNIKIKYVYVVCIYLYQHSICLPPLKNRIEYKDNYHEIF